MPATPRDPIRDFDPSKPLRSRVYGNREKFVRELLCGTPVCRAYEIAGFKRPAGNAQRLERDAQVQARLAYLREQMEGREELELFLRRLRVRTLLEKLIGEDRSTMFTDEGKLRPLSELTDDQRALLDSIRPTRAGPEAIMPSKLAAIQALARIEGLEAPSRADVNVTMDDQRFTDVELARWIAAKLEDGASAVEVLPAAVTADCG
jgi:hypothetical protein